MLPMFFAWLNDDEKGQGMVEYGIMIAVVALVVLLGLALLGTNLNTAFSSLATWVSVHITT